MQTADEVQVGREIQSTPTLYLLIPNSHVNEGSIPTFVSQVIAIEKVDSFRPPGSRSGRSGPPSTRALVGAVIGS